MSTPVRPPIELTKKKPSYRPQWSNVTLLDGNESTASPTTSAKGPVLVVVVLHLALFVGYVTAYGHLSAFSCVSEARLGEAPYHAVKVGFARGGYDGQFYFALAQQAPWAKHIVGIDAPRIRQLRIAYPAISWALSGGGRVDLLFWVMPLVNLLAIAGLALLGAKFAVRQGLSAWWGLLLPLAANAGLPALRNLTDVLAAFSVGMLLYCWLVRASAGWVFLAALLTVFSREQGIGVAGLVMLGMLWQRRWASTACVAVALCLWVGWVGYLWNLYDASPFLSTSGHFTWPLTGAIFRWNFVAETMTPTRALLHRIFLVLLVFQLPVALYLLRVCRDPVLLLAAGFGATLMLLGGSKIYVDLWSCMRVYNWLAVVLCLALLQARRPTLIVPMALLSLTVPAAVVSALMATA